MLPMGGAGRLCVQRLSLPWMYVLFKLWPPEVFLSQSCQQSPADPGKPSVPEVAPDILLPLVLCCPKDAPAGPSGPQKLSFR